MSWWPAVSAGYRCGFGLRSQPGDGEMPGTTARDVIALPPTERSTVLPVSCKNHKRPLWVGLLVAAVSLTSGCSESPEHRQAVKDLMALRSERDSYMASADSPLTPEQRGRFKGLAYFNPDFELVFEAELDVEADPDTVRMLTTSGGIDLYLRYAHFPLHYMNQDYALTVFLPVVGEGFFLPFTDTTSGNETYGAARYIELVPIGDERYRVDFNRAYNPYCAYNPKWACPIAPPENNLPFAVRAGERKYPYAQHASP